MTEAATPESGHFTEPAWLRSAPYDRVFRDEKGNLWLPLGQQLAPSLQLVAYSEVRVRELGNWGGRLSPRPGWETLLLELTVRGRHLHEATMRLLRSGYAAAALAPARALFELMMNTYWVFEHRATPGRFLQNLWEHQRFHNQMLRDELSRLPNYGGPVPDVPPFADKAEARAARKKWGTSFTEESIFARIKRWTNPEHLDIAPNASPDEASFFPETRPGELAAMYSCGCPEPTSASTAQWTSTSTASRRSAPHSTRRATS